MFSNQVKVCDGGLGSTLALDVESVNSDPLWSARLLHSNPAAILKVHRDFVAAGSDILVSASYQASVKGFVEQLEVTVEEALGLIQKSVLLARTAAQDAGKNDTLVAGSVGPYGACQNDGSEYTGAHVSTMMEEQLMNWHRPRIQQLVQAGASLLAVETLPAVKEALAVLRLLKEFPGTKAWISFSCKDSSHTNAGDDFPNAIAQCCTANPESLVGVGVNCSCPGIVSSLLESLNKHSGVPPPTVMPRVVYPNSGEIWVAGQGWTAAPTLQQWPVKQWIQLGARVVGGCCRVGPDDIRGIVETVDKIDITTL
ncbi:Homocysteine-binding domain [Trinorchestia longiramus]|nr:Homocysteine-binding domain [Trinorchestia longiramus]